MSLASQELVFLTTNNSWTLLPGSPQGQIQSQESLRPRKLNATAFPSVPTVNLQFLPAQMQLTNWVIFTISSGA